jgi:hypothetical protein
MVELLTATVVPELTIPLNVPWHCVVPPIQVVVTGPEHVFTKLAEQVAVVPPF